MILKSEKKFSHIYVDENNDKHFNDCFLCSEYFVTSKFFQNSILTFSGASISLCIITNPILVSNSKDVTSHLNGLLKILRMDTFKIFKPKYLRNYEKVFQIFL